MKITVESTEEFATVDGQPCRIWRGATSDGVPIIALIAAVGTHKDSPPEPFADLVAFPAIAP